MMAMFVHDSLERLELPESMAKRKIFIVHPSDWLTDHMSIGDGLVAHGFLNELSKRGHEIHIAARTASYSEV